jgi:uncharacterized protein (DUF2267 family)
MMDYGTFINRVQKLAGLKYTWEAVIAIRSTLSVLQTIVFKGEKRLLAAALPVDIQDLIRTSEEMENIDLTEFLSRISESAEIKISDALKQAKAVLFVLQQIMTGDEARIMHVQLPKEFNVLFTTKKRTNDILELPNVALTRKMIYQPSL